MIGPLDTYVNAPGAFQLIVLADTEVMWTNQAGGHACEHPEAEGFAYQLVHAKDLWLVVEHYFSRTRGGGVTFGGTFTEEDADFIEEIVLHKSTTGLCKVDRARLDECAEAWVHVIVEGDYPLPHHRFAGMDYPVRAILVWDNSD